MHRSVLLPLLLVSGSAFAWGDCEFTARRDATLDLAGAKKLALMTGAGDLRIVADASATTVMATGKACASSQALLDKIQLATMTEGGVPTMKADMPEYEGSWLGNTYAWLDLEVRVPKTVAVALTDSSGDVEAEGLAALDAHDSSGDLKIRDTAGEVAVVDSSGDVVVRGAGSVHVRSDSSGDLVLESVTGDVLVDTDSSGDVDIEHVGGNAHVGNDSSGEIEFDDVKGSAIVDHDSSGSISAEDIGGDFIVRADGSGGVSHHGVKGRVDVPEDD